MPMELFSFCMCSGKLEPRLVIVSYIIIATNQQYSPSCNMQNNRKKLLMIFMIDVMIFIMILPRFINKWLEQHYNYDIGTTLTYKGPIYAVTV